MELFSQRKGLKPVKTKIQVDSIDDELRNGLWNALTQYYWENIKSGYWNLSDDRNAWALFLCRRIWLDYFKVPVDTLNYDWRKTLDIIRHYFFECGWNEVYDFIEFVASNYPNKYASATPDFRTYCNHILEREVSAYRFVGD